MINSETPKDFAPVAVADVKKISFAAWLPATGAAMAVDLFYSSRADEETVVYSTGGSWKTFNVTSFLDSSQSDLVGISFWGETSSHTSPGNPSYLDAVSISTTVPEPSTWAMLLVGLGTLGFDKPVRSLKAAANLARAG